MARLCPCWKHMWQHVHGDVVTLLPSSVSLPLAQCPMALMTSSREQKGQAGTLYCASTVSSVHGTGLLRRPCGRGAAALCQLPTHGMLCPGHTPAVCPAWRVPIPILPLQSHCAVPRPSAQWVLPLHGFGSSLPWDGREQGPGGGESWKRCRKGLVARMHHGNAPGVLPCTAAPSHDGSTLWTRAHSLAPTSPVFFLGLSSVEQLDRWIRGVLQNMAVQ